MSVIKSELNSLKYCTQIYSSRPLFPYLRTTPLAGSRLSSHLRALLLLFGTYHPPIQSLSTPATQPTPASSRATRVPEELLTDSLIEDLKTRCCLVGEALDSDIRMASPIAYDEIEPSDATTSESGFSRVSADMESNASVSQQEATASSDFSIISPSQVPSNFDRPRPGESHLQALANLYTRYSTATDLRIRVDPPPSQQTGTGRGTLVVPGWIRERAAEVLFEGGDVDESSVAEVILDSLLKVGKLSSCVQTIIAYEGFMIGFPTGSGGSAEVSRLSYRHRRGNTNAPWVYPTATY